MKLLKAILIVFLLFVGFVCYGLFVPKHYMTSYSPDGKYKLIVYAIPKLFSMPGDGSTKCTKVKLYKGWRQIKNNCSECPAFTSSIDITWYLDDKAVNFAKGRGISLETGDCE